MSKLPHAEEKKSGATISDSVSTGESITMELQPRSSEPKKTDMESWQKVHDAIKSGDLGELQRLIEEENIDVNISDEEMSDTPLHLASHYGMHDIAEWLVFKGADAVLKNYYESTPLDTAVCSKKWQVVKILLKHQSIVSDAIANYEDYMMLMIRHNDGAMKEVRKVFVESLKQNFPEFMPCNKEPSGVLLGTIELVREQPNGCSFTEAEDFLHGAGFDSRFLYQKAYGYNVPCAGESGWYEHE